MEEGGAFRHWRRRRRSLADRSAWNGRNASLQPACVPLVKHYIETYLLKEVPACASNKRTLLKWKEVRDIEKSCKQSAACSIMSQPRLAQ